MVCFQEEGPVDCSVCDSTQEGTKRYTHLQIQPSMQVSHIFNEVAAAHLYKPEELWLVLHNRDGASFVLNNFKDKTIRDVGVKCLPDECNEIAVSSLKNKNLSCDCANEDDLHLGASASPTTATSGGVAGRRDPKTSMDEFCANFDARKYCVPAADPINYVGLVNQAMTCYLNSLLQALYMTPEFRNALYNWAFDGQNEHRSIPFQLQKLFLNLQTSSKSAVETTDLTTSFGWQGSDAWHQHDIQELCRVMFDALEQKFKDTKQSNLINDLYEGKMLDYVKCLECGTEGSREDTFQDIPLPVRPFGSTVAYNSVEEALRAFVQPETLDGNNQYHCEKCNKKCDAHKGLKFTKFPYLLTLHLKRFDFDYNTMHRIKLNDKVVFPEILNLNSFIPTSKTDQQENNVEERETAVKCDDCSTTDSGSADDESCQGTDVSSTVNGPDDNCADSDEGIDVSSGTNHENEAKGPYIYELFSIMIHSGSASGGHYYAYIKDFDKDRWFCFNDQSVSAITEDDIRKTYGGGPQRGYYSGAYSSSTNAYMLMYRQIDKDRNCRAIDVENFPPHIKKLLEHMRQKEEEDRISREKENDMIKLNVFCQNQATGNLDELRINMYSDSTLAEAACHAHYRFKLTDYVDVKDCRLVIYNKKHDCVQCSFDDDELKFCDISNQINKEPKKSTYLSMMFTDWMLEIKKPDKEFQTYKNGGVNMKVYPVDLDAEEVNEPSSVRVDLEDTVGDVKCKISRLLNFDMEYMKVVMHVANEAPVFFEDDSALVVFDPKFVDFKLFVAFAQENVEKALLHAKMHKVMDKFGSLISINVVLPDTDVGTLESLSIPSLDLNQNLDKLELSGGGAGASSPGLRVSPQPGGMSGDGFGGDQSNSEDSSLSDSDRTLVGDAPGGEFAGDYSSTMNSPADQHMASPSNPAEDNFNHDVFAEEMNWDDDETRDAAGQGKDGATREPNRPHNRYFKVTSVVHQNARCVRILADRRMTMERLKKHLEVFVRVPVDYFKLFRQYGNTEDEWSTLTDSLKTLKDGERIVVKLGRVLGKDEVNCKIYHLKLDYSEPNTFLFEHIVAKGQTVGVVKREILVQMKKQHMLDVHYTKCRLRDKSWKKPRKVYLDDQIFGDDIIMTSNMDIYLQELHTFETVTSDTSAVLFVRRWCPSTLQLERLQEIAMDTQSVDEMRQRISDVSGIPTENVDFAHVKTAFPCDMHLLEIADELTWNPNVQMLQQWPLNADDGSVFFYRDNRETPKELTAEERKEINQRENSRLGRHSTKSPGRERALKIYLDTSPAKPDDHCTD
ncbi:unnamed protein product [Brassicogethes aeneus]|uniref:Ubiquitin carboxyl-terminal hydrolase 47 n=1 Tax=Brassicogethes aeneus TaxID=1431903 RepID=A0A9P0FAN3_BRAAE|nr:unnamed protein product [Brassicogethes aeneus]